MINLVCTIKGVVIMRNLIIDNSLSFIKRNCSYDDVKLAEIKYGLEAIYILITKSIIIFTLSFILGIFKEVVIFTLLYSLIRMFSFGLHATKSWICLVSSLITFVTIPFICKYIDINIYLKTILNIISIILIYKNAPADTYKRPIINKKRRERYKFISTFIAIIMSFMSLVIRDNFLSNSLMFATVVQNFMISPYIYKLFKLPYDNYKKYLNEV